MDYKNGKIYKLINDDLGLTYYGSTVTTLTKRLCGHKSKSKTNTNHCKSKLLFTGGAVEIFLVEEFPCENKDQLNKRERFYIESNECVNKNIPGRTKKEYYEANKEAIKDQNKEWREANKEQIKEYKEANKETILENKKKWREANKESIAEQKKIYKEANKEKIKEQNKEWREANKEKMAEKITCECGATISRGAKTVHLKTKKHLKYSGGLSSN